jgi:hypothetical protein
VTALDKVLKLQRAQIKGIIELRGIRKMAPMYEEVRAEMEAKLRALVKRGMGESFSAYHARLVMLQLKAGIQQFGNKLVGHLDSTGAQASALGAHHTVYSVKALEKQFVGHAPVLQVEQAAVLRGVYKDVHPALLNRYKKSEAYYTKPVVEQVKMQMAKSIISGEGVDEAIDRVVGTDGVFAAQRWRAERIVRTELSHSYGVTQYATMRKVQEEIPKLQRKLIETFDDRTGDDSKRLHGQVRDMGDPFVYTPPPGKKGYPPFMMPPGRPNDRAVVIPWSPSWQNSSVTRPDDDGPGDVTAEVPQGLTLP